MKQRSFVKTVLLFLLIAVLTGMLPIASLAETAAQVFAPDPAQWGRQNNNGWYYLYQDLITGEYSQMPFVKAGTEGENFTGCFSADRVFPYCFIAADKMHPATNANVVNAFRAPTGGSVTIKLTLCRSARPQQGSPSLLRVMRGNEQIFPADGSWYEITNFGSDRKTLEIPMELARDEWVYVVLSCGGSNTNGEVQITQQAVYSRKTNAALPTAIPVPKYEGFQIRTNQASANRQDLRFRFSLSKDAFGDNGKTAAYTMTELGVLWQKASVLSGKSLTQTSGMLCKAETLDASQSGKLMLSYTVSGIGPQEVQERYYVRPYVKCILSGTERVFYGDTVDASVWDYLANGKTAYQVKTYPVAIDMTSGRITSKAGSLVLTPAYIAKAQWHSTRPVEASSVNGMRNTAVVSGGTLTTSAQQQSDGSLSITQQGAVTKEGIGGLGFTLQFSMNYDVILPAWGGIRLTKASPNAAPFPGDPPRSCLQYPLEWDAQMFLIQRANSGWLIYQNDCGTNFKNLWLSNDGNNYSFTVESVPQAPYTQYTSFTACPWVIVAYEGDWTAGMALYKKFSDEKFGQAQINASKPAWISEIQSVMLTDLNNGTLPMLREMANHADPSKILLIVPGWRADLYDVNYPNYTPNANLKSYIDQVHALGYRVFLHANLIGCDDDAPEYTTYGLEDDRYLNDKTGQPYLESWTSSYSVSFWLINPASPDWQDLLVSRLVEVYRNLGVDGFHLDQSLLAYNDNRGLVNGMTSMQGVMELQRKLAKALPNCGFSGEGTNEFNCRYSSFLQRAPYGIHSAGANTWDDGKVSQILPVESFLWSDAARLYHYAAMPTSANEAVYDAWCRAGIRLGALPTLMRSSAYELKVQTIATQKALSLFRWYQENCPKMSVSPWADGFVQYRTKTGQTVCVNGTQLW